MNCFGSNGPFECSRTVHFDLLFTGSCCFGVSPIYRSLFKPAARVDHPSRLSVAVPFFLRFFLIYDEY